MHDFLQNLPQSTATKLRNIEKITSKLDLKDDASTHQKQKHTKLMSSVFPLLFFFFFSIESFKNFFFLSLMLMITFRILWSEFLSFISLPL